MKSTDIYSTSDAPITSIDFVSIYGFARTMQSSLKFRQRETVFLNNWRCVPVVEAASRSSWVTIEASL